MLECAGLFARKILDFTDFVMEERSIGTCKNGDNKTQGGCEGL